MLASSIPQVQIDFLRTELKTGHVLANIALSATDQPRQVGFTQNAIVAYETVLRFIGRVALPPGTAREIANGIGNLKHKLEALEEKRWNVVGRRLEDRIRQLAVKSEEFPNDSPASHEIAELMKTEITEYFEREKNPPYRTDRRFKGQSFQSADYNNWSP